MRVLIHSNGPHVRTGYGVECYLLVHHLQQLGHEVAVSCLYGLAGQPITWNGVALFPAGRADFGADVLAGHANLFAADVVICLMDYRKLLPIAPMLARESWPLLAWLPVDTNDKLGRPDKLTLEQSKALPVAMSRHGLRLLHEAKFADAVYVPHTVDLDVFKQPADRDKLRKELGVDDRFVVGLNAANMDAARKSFPEQFEAFANFRKRHKDAFMLLHSQMLTARGFDLYEMIEDFGLTGAVRETVQYVHTAGLMDGGMMADWYGACDLLTNASYAEGFGLPIVEAQACGTPVVVTKASAMTELAGPGWTVGGESFWNPAHRARWVRPSVRALTAAYNEAYQNAADLRDQSAAFARQYDTATAAELYWKPILEGIEE